MTGPSRHQTWWHGRGLVLPGSIVHNPGPRTPGINGTPKGRGVKPRVVIAPPKSHPRNGEEVMRWIGEGRLTPVQAFDYFQQMENGTVAEQRNRENHQALETSLSELDSLVGLGEVKKLVRELHAFVQVQRFRREAGLAADALALHMVFRGNPGTGKTTVARILGNIFREAGVLAKGHLLEVERADLVGEYIGHTAQKTRELLKKAMGGILFIDEAYSLARGGSRDFGKEAIDTLVKAMEDHRDNLILVLAGYRDEMDWFLQQNPGLRSRFPVQLVFPDYTADELMAIGRQMLQQRQYTLSPAAESQLQGFTLRAAADPALGNARGVRNLIEYAIRRQALRLMQGDFPPTREQLMLLQGQDLEGFGAS